MRESLRLGILAVELEENFFQVQDDVGHVFNHAVEGGKFVHRAIDFDRGDGRAFERGEQHAAERVADGVAVTGFKRLSDEFGVCFRGGASSLTRLSAFRNDRNGLAWF